MLEIGGGEEGKLDGLSNEAEEEPTDVGEEGGEEGERVESETDGGDGG